MTPRTRHNIKNALYLALFVGSVLGFTFWFMTLAANAAGSDSETPYTVGLHGIQLPAGDTFKAHGHVNLRTADGQSYGVHFDPYNNQPGGAWIGKSFIPYEAFGLKSTDACVTWVQISHYNEHWGEGGQAPVGKACKAKPTPTPEPTPEPSPTVTPEPEPPVTPEPEPSVTPEPTPEPTPACGPIGSCGTVPERAEDALEPSPEPTFAASSTGPRYVDAPTDVSSAAPAGDRDATPPILAETGPALAAPLVAAAVLTVLGVGGVAMSRRWKA